MPTRFYLSNTAPSYTPSSPVHQGTWTNGAQTTAKALTGRPSGATGTTAVQIGNTNANRSMLCLRGITEPAVAAGTISGTVQWVLGVLESNAALNAFFMVHIWVSTGDSTTVRGTLLNMSSGGTEWPTSYAGRTEGNKTLTSVAIQVGDRIIVELGYIASSSLSTYTGTYRFGGTSATDLTDGGTNTADPPWIEFSGAEGLFTGAVSDLTSEFTSSIPATFDEYGSVTPSISGGRLRMQPQGTDDFTGVQSNVDVQFDTDGVFVEVPTVLSAAGSTSNAYMHMSVVDVVTGTGSYVGVLIDALASQINFFIWDAYFDPSPTTLTYNATNHRWVRIRRSGNSILWDTSADGSSWTNRRTLTSPASWVNYQDLALLLEAYKDGATASIAEWDNLNTVPANVNLDRPISDAVTVSEAVGRALLRTRSISDTVTAGEAVARAVTWPRSITDTVTAADTVARMLATARGIADTVTAADSAAGLIAVARAIADAVTAADGVAGSVNRPAAGADTVTAGDSVARLLETPRGTGDTVTAADSIARLLVQARGLADTATAGDTVGGVASLPRAIADAVTAGENVARLVAIARAITDSATIADSVARTAARGRSIADAVTAGEAVATLLVTARAIADAVTVADLASTGGGTPRSISDAVTVSDSVGTARGVGRDASSAVVFDDAVQLSGASLTRPAGDTVTAADEAQRDLVLGAELGDTVTAADTVDRVLSAATGADDGVLTADQVAQLLAAGRAIADAVELADDVVSGQAFSASTDDAVTVADTVARAPLGLGRDVTDQVMLAEDLTGTIVMVRGIADLVEVAEAVQVGRLFSAGTSDTVTVADGVAGNLGQGVAGADQVAASDAVAWNAAVFRDGSAFLFFGDVAGREHALARTAVVFLTAADLGSATAGRARTAVDDVDFDDVVFAIVTGPVPILLARPHRIRMTFPTQSVTAAQPPGSVRRTG